MKKFLLLFIPLFFLGFSSNDSAEKFFETGFELQSEQKYEEALKEYQKATQIKPDYFEVWSNIGFVHTMLRDFDKASEAFKKALRK